MINEKGNIQIDQVNMFPVIKKWLYADKDIFIREVVSNGMDAITKLINISNGGQYTLPEGTKWRVDIKVDAENKTLTFIDNGIGMTESEVKKYINQVAFSGAKEFAEKYKEYVNKDAAEEIIGHFGLGFYSTFMVSSKVEIDTLSFMEGAEAVHWESESGMDFEMSSSQKAERGTAITLHIAEDSEEFLNVYKVKEIVRKYCYFLPHEIYVTDVNEKHECKCNHEDGECTCNHEEGECTCHHEEGEECTCHKETPVNDTKPLWVKAPSECTDEEYKEFYKRVFNDYNEPLFWIHLNVDYPFRLKGVLYFPQVPDKFQPFEGMVKLYSNQVFIADNVKEVIPEFLMLLKGCLDCQDLPLNVSRSFLQNDGYVSKISKHITKKIAEKLKSLFNNNRDDYNKYWDDINLFIKYGCLKDDKFYDMMKDYLVFKTINDEYKVMADIADPNSEEKTKIFYVTDKNQQAQMINMFKESEQEAVYLDTLIDRNFINFLEYKNDKLSFVRIDSDIAATLKSDGVIDTKLGEEAVELFKSALNRDDVEVTFEAMKNGNTPAVIFLSEESRRIREMYEHYKMGGMEGELDIDSMFPMKYKVVLNTNNDLIGKLCEKADNKDIVNMLAAQVYDMALMNLRPLTPDEVAEFTKRSVEIMNMVL